VPQELKKMQTEVELNGITRELHVEEGRSQEMPLQSS